MSTKFDQIKQLFDNQLYSNVISLIELILTAGNQTCDLITGFTKFQTYIYYAQSLYQIEEYKKALHIYKNALMFKKSLLKGKGSPKAAETPKDFMSDTDIKYEMHLCYQKLKDTDESFNILTSIPGKQRTPKVNMALGQMYQDNGNERSAITCYKEVLKESPLALQAAQGLLCLGVKGVEVHSLILEPSMGVSVKNLNGIDWVNAWIRAHAHMYAKEYKQAIHTFRQLEEGTPFSNNSSLLISLGELYYLSGDFKNALFNLKKANDIEKLQNRGLDIYAAVLYHERKISDLERLIPTSLPAELNAEMCTAIAYLLFAMKNYSKALYMAQRACTKDPKSVEPLILKGTILFDLKKYSDAVSHFREALHIAPHRYEPHKGVIDSYTALNRHREALSVAGSMYRMLPNSPRAITLYASLLVKDPAENKVIPLLKKALALDEQYLPAVFCMAEVVAGENIHKAIEILEKQRELNSSWRLFYMLGDYYTRIHEEEKAFEMFSKALSLSPNNRKVIDSISKLESAGSVNTPAGVKMDGVKLESSYYTNNSDGETTENFNDTIADSSDHETEMIADSEGDQVWPDILDQNTNRMSRR
ncbi:hypothetical protein M8J75_010997 [Diaphorina citri]|nr:hypothetical protein M8J75_010997 [Diaphorina citri]KAI5739284.1 hypothetical protein M8J77_017293 [Diaphorina citri]